MTETKNVERAIARCLEEAAKSLQWVVEIEPYQLGRSSFAFSHQGTNDTEDDQWPRCGLFIGDFAVLIGSLGGDPDDALDVALEAHLERAAISRSYLDPRRKENLLLFLVGYPSESPRAVQSPRWSDVKYQIERDERVCRKMVFLTPNEPSLLDVEIDRFLARTFLARPWQKSDSQAELDPLLATLSSSRIPESWVDIMQRGLPAGDALVDALIDALTKEGLIA